MGMNAYLYAPKDDIKHRQSWRDLYTPEEEQQLQFLITESTEAGVLFIFAISPGLDVTFSSAKEVDILKKKVDQVSVYTVGLFIKIECLQNVVRTQNHGFPLITENLISLGT